MFPTRRLLNSTVRLYRVDYYPRGARVAQGCRSFDTESSALRFCELLRQLAVDYRFVSKGEAR